MKEHNPGKNVRVFMMDEARFGQRGTLTKVWVSIGSRPTMVKQTKYEWVYLYAAVDPRTGASSALLTRHVNTPSMGGFLKILSAEVGPNDHVVLVLDNAGWHVSKKLACRRTSRRCGCRRTARSSTRSSGCGRTSRATT